MGNFSESFVIFVSVILCKMGNNNKNKKKYSGYFRPYWTYKIRLH
jgi:hypothetical protein